jgi:hypothetical protein
MTQGCGCHEHGGATGTITRPAAVDGGWTVREVLEAKPESRAVLAELGLNHCCGAHLTLTEAAASAGVPLERVLAALGATVAS